MSNRLLERCRRKLDNFSQTESTSVAVGTILDRPPKLPVKRNEVAGRSRAGPIDHHRIACVRCPRAEQLAGIEDGQRVRIPACTVTASAKQIVEPIATDDGRVSQFLPGKQRGMALPSVRKIDAFVERDVSV